MDTTAEFSDRISADPTRKWEAGRYCWQALASLSISDTGLDIVNAPLVPKDSHAISLQEYWRRDCATGRVRSDQELLDSGELIAGPDRTFYHLLHLPLHYAGLHELPTAKTDDAAAIHARCRMLVAERIASAERAGDANEQVAWLQGVVLAGEIIADLASRQCRIILDDALFGSLQTVDSVAFNAVSFRKAVFSKGLLCRDATFERDVDFAGARFGGWTEFIGTRFTSDAVFDDCVFASGACFNAIDCARRLYFRKTAFHSIAKFNESRLSEAGFAGARFKNIADFTSVSFGGVGDFQGVVFSGRTTFTSSKFQDDVLFKNVEVGTEGALVLDAAVVAGQADFSDLHCNGDLMAQAFDCCGPCTFFNARLSVLEMNGARFASGVNLQQIKVDSNVNARTLYVQGAAINFRYVDCQGWVDFGHSIFDCDALFQGTTFHLWSSFDEVQFRKEMKFELCTFKRIVYFTQITWPVLFRHRNRVFDKVIFEQLANFHKSGFRSFSAFDGARFDQGIRLDKVDEDTANARFTRELEEIRDLKSWEKVESRSKPGTRKGLRFRRIREDRANAELLQRRENYLEELENACRLLKQQMEMQSDKTREQLFYRFELLARRAQRTTPWLERRFSDLYRNLSDYAGSQVKPIVWLVVVWMTFAVAYAGFVGYTELNPAQTRPVTNAGFDLFKEAAWRRVTPSELVLQSAALSASRIFPFGAFEDVSKNFGNRLECKTAEGDPMPHCVWEQPLKAFAFRALATLQSFIALILAFLFGLSVRRRFQIS